MDGHLWRLIAPRATYTPLDVAPSDAIGLADHIVLANRLKSKLATGHLTGDPGARLAYIAALRKIAPHHAVNPPDHPYCYHTETNDDRRISFCVTRSVNIELALSYLTLAAQYSRLAQSALGTASDPSRYQTASAHLHRAANALRLTKQHCKEHSEDIRLARQALPVAQKENIRTALHPKQLSLRQAVLEAEAQECLVSHLELQKNAPGVIAGYVAEAAARYDALHTDALGVNNAVMAQYARVKTLHWEAASLHRASQATLAGPGNDGSGGIARGTETSDITQALQRTTQASVRTRALKALIQSDAARASIHPDLAALAMAQHREIHRYTKEKTRLVQDVHQLYTMPELVPIPPLTIESQHRPIAALEAEMASALAIHLAGVSHPGLSPVSPSGDATAQLPSFKAMPLPDTVYPLARYCAMAVAGLRRGHDPLKVVNALVCLGIAHERKLTIAVLPDATAVANDLTVLESQMEVYFTSLVSTATATETE